MMKSENLMIIDPSLEIPEIESYNEISLCSPLKTTYHLPEIHSPKTMTKYFANTKGIILMGSAASVHDSHSWMSSLEQVIKSAVQKHIPILGICFGHQFLAHIFGGTVDTLWQNSKKVGVRKVKVLQNNLLEKSKTDFLIYSHREGVVKCPANFEIAATSNMVNIEGLVHKTLPIWTFQPHIEASKTFSRRIGLSADEFNKCDFFGKQLLKSFFNKLK